MSKGNFRIKNYNIIKFLTKHILICFTGNKLTSKWKKITEPSNNMSCITTLRFELYSDTKGFASCISKNVIHLIEKYNKINTTNIQEMNLNQFKGFCQSFNRFLYVLKLYVFFGYLYFSFSSWKKPEYVTPKYASLT